MSQNGGGSEIVSQEAVAFEPVDVAGLGEEPVAPVAFAIGRAETGPMAFGDDLSGVFIRGDDAARFAFNLADLLAEAEKTADKVLGPSPLQIAVLRGFLSDLEASRDPEPPAQKMRPFLECRAGEKQDELISLHEVEKRHVLRVLVLVKGNKSKAARILGLDRRTLYRKLAVYLKEGV